MHFVTGGFYNGKSAWVKEKYAVDEWISAYAEAPLIIDDSSFTGNIVVLEGLEEWTKELAKKQSLNEVRIFFQGLLDTWQSWENSDAERKLILIGTDIMKGIVPMVEEERNWRDLTGWFYQDIVRASDRVDVIWYGINQMIK